MRHSGMRRQAQARNPFRQRLMAYYVYLLANDKYGTLYVGITNDIVRRVYSTKASLSRVSPSDIRSTN